MRLSNAIRTDIQEDMEQSLVNSSRWTVIMVLIQQRECLETDPTRFFSFRIVVIVVMVMIMISVSVIRIHQFHPIICIPFLSPIVELTPIDAVVINQIMLNLSQSLGVVASNV